MGFGLSISKMIVQQLNGSIGVNSEVEKGSTFNFDIEVEVPNDLSLEESKNSLPSNIIVRNPLEARQLGTDDTFT